MTEVPNSTKTFIFIDGSYYCFHRYYSIMRWWKSANPDKILEDPFQHAEFLEKFIKTFVDTVKEIPKKIGINKNEKFTMIVGKDCKREEIWRNSVQEKYKANRKNGVEDGFMGGAFFKMAFEDGLFQKGGVQSVLNHATLEADDCIALSVKHLLQKYVDDPLLKIYIITSDKDYLQLIGPQVKIYDLSYKNIAEQKSSFGDADANLFCKIVMGDSSDNIPAIFKKCGPKTALKCYQDKEYFQTRMKNENAFERFEINKQMIDFNYIPIELADAFYANCAEIMESW